MREKVNLKEIERRVYTSYHQDGLIDIFAGLFMLSFGLLIILDMSWMGWMFLVVGGSIYATAKRAFTVPRIGYVKFPQQRMKRTVAGLVVAGSLSFVLGIVTFMQFEGGSAPAWLLFAIEYHMIVIGVSVAALSCVAGYAFRAKRMYAYALLTLGMFLAGQFLHFPLHYYVILLGTLILLNGLIMLIRFVRRYPLSATGTVSGSGHEEE